MSKIDELYPLYPDDVLSRESVREGAMRAAYKDAIAVAENERLSFLGESLHAMHNNVVRNVVEALVYRMREVCGDE